MLKIIFMQKSHGTSKYCTIFVLEMIESLNLRTRYDRKSSTIVIFAILFNKKINKKQNYKSKIFAQFKYMTI